MDNIDAKIAELEKGICELSATIAALGKRSGLVRTPSVRN
jgi:hypothetical protein